MKNTKSFGIMLTLNVRKTNCMEEWDIYYIIIFGGRRATLQAI